MTESKSDGINREDASLLLGLSTTKSTAPVTSAGRELDALVAEKVFGVACVHSPIVWPLAKIVARNRAQFLEDYGEDAPPAWEGDAAWELESDYPPKMCSKCGLEDHNALFVRLPKYSTSIADAWLVVEKLSPNHLSFSLEMVAGGLWVAVFLDIDEDDYTNIHGSASSKSAPHAICLAAIQAVGA